MTGGYEEPGVSGGLRLNPAMILNHLLLVWSIDYIPHSPTRYTQPGQPCDVVVVDVVDLDDIDPNTGVPGLLARKCWWRQSRLIQALKERIGNVNPMLIRVTRSTANPGATSPYELVSQLQDPQAIGRADIWRRANPSFQPSIATPIPVAPMPEAPNNYRAPQQQPTPLENYAQHTIQQPVPPVPQPTSAIMDSLQARQDEARARLKRMSERNQPGQGEPPF